MPILSPVTDYYTPNEAAEILKVNPRTVRRWVAAGKLEALTLPSGRVRIPKAALEPYSTQSRATP